MSTFGFGGTNAHIIIEEAPAVEDTAEAVTAQKTDGQKVALKERSHHVLVLTAKTSTALRSLASRYQSFLSDYTLKEREQYSLGTSVDLHWSSRLLANVCFTANTGRSCFSQRLCLVSHSVSDMRRQLAQFAEGEETLLASQFIAGRVKGRKRHKVVFYFPEVTKGTLRLGRVLYQTQPAFKGFFDSCAQHCERDLAYALLSDSGSGDFAALTTSPTERIAGFVVAYALAKLWQHWGVSPSGLVTEGIADYVAACATGLMDVKEALSQLTSLINCGLSASSPKATSSQKLFAQAMPTSNDIVLPIGANRSLASCTIASSVKGTNTPQQSVSFGRELSLNGDISVWPQLLCHLSQLFVSGVVIDWRAFDEGYRRRRLTLPTYPFERSRYWFTQPEPSNHQPSDSQSLNHTDSHRKVVNNSSKNARSKINKSKKVVSL